MNPATRYYWRIKHPRKAIVNISFKVNQLPTFKCMEFTNVTKLLPNFTKNVEQKKQGTGKKVHQKDHENLKKDHIKFPHQ